MKTFNAIALLALAGAIGPAMTQDFTKFREALKKAKAETNLKMPELVANLTKRLKPNLAELKKLKDNAEFSMKKNQDDSLTFELAVNDLSIMDEEDFDKINVADPEPAVEEDENVHTIQKRATYTYAYKNYTALKMVTSVKNQGQCGSCYAFAAVANMESLYLMKGKGTQDFSEQQIVDCTNKTYTNAANQVFNSGCNGGNPRFVLMYFNETKVVSETTRNYTGKAAATCSVTPQKQTVFVDYAYLKPTSEDHLAYMLDKNGPITIFMNANSKSFQQYKSGVFNDIGSCNATGVVNHLMLLTGLVKDPVSGQEQWILKNSWGTSWGEQGYVRFPKGVNMCNMMYTQATFPYLTGTKPILS